MKPRIRIIETDFHWIIREIVPTSYWFAISRQAGKHILFFPREECYAKQQKKVFMKRLETIFGVN